jgi:hypothetical protein
VAQEAMADRVLAWVSERRDRWRRYGLIGALALFTAGLAWATSSIGDLSSRLEPAPLLLLLAIGAPVGMLLNSVELWAISRIAGGPIGWRASLEVTVYGSASNMLPLPGAALTKVVAMKAQGIGYGKGSAMILLSYAIWGGLAFLYSGGALWLLGQGAAAAGFVALGCVLLLGGWLGFARFGTWRLIGVVALMRLISFPLEALRYMLALAALSASVAFIQASVFVVASFLGSAVMLAPSGLGIGETMVALLSPIVEIDPALGFTAAAAGRAVWMAGLILCAGALLLTAGGGRAVQSGSA